MQILIGVEHVVLKFLGITGFTLLLATQALSANFTVEDYRGRKSIRMSGEIDNGSAAKLEAIIGQAENFAHGYPVLLLDSPGGSVSEALRISDLLERHPVHTVIPDGARCASACASIIFISGKYRTMDIFGAFGQHSCSINGKQDDGCNEILAEHATEHGVSHGSVAAFVTYTPPSDILWMSRQDIDGWGISRYPGVEAVGFQHSEPRIFSALGMKTESQNLWRLDFMEDGWRAFLRPARDDERELQLNITCTESRPGRLIFFAEILGNAEVIEQAATSVNFFTDAFGGEDLPVAVTQMDEQASMIGVVIPKEMVLDLLQKADEFFFEIVMKPPYTNISASGNFKSSRKNLIFAANNCSS